MSIELVVSRSKKLLAVKARFRVIYFLSVLDGITILFESTKLAASTKFFMKMPRAASSMGDAIDQK